MKYLTAYIAPVLVLMSNNVFAGGGISPAYKTEDLTVSAFLVILSCFILVSAVKWRNVKK